MPLLRAALPVVAVVAFIATVAAILGSAGSTLGYDFQAYVGAARRALEGLPLYDATVDTAGGFAIYLYPPPFALALIPFALLPDQAALWLWQGLAIASFVVGVAILPVRPTVRWGVLLLGAVDWPLLFAFKLGQVGPLLFLLFAIGWRWMDRAIPLGLTIAAGTVVKVQPLLLLAWAALTGRWRAVWTSLAVLAVAAGVSTAVFGWSVWSDYAALLGRVNSPITTPHNFTLGAIAYQAGVPAGIAEVLQIATLVTVVLAVVIAIRWASDDVSYLCVVVATQLLSPLVWDHYAVVLLLPVAWLLERGQWWAIGIVLLTAIPLTWFLPVFVYPIAFAMGLLGPLVVRSPPSLPGRRRAFAGDACMTSRLPFWRRIARDGLVMLGILAAVGYWLYLTRTGGLPVDVRWYWEADPNNLYPHPELAERNGYNYSPAFEWIVGWWRWMPFEAFVAIWRAILLALLVWMAGPFTIFVLFTVPVASEINAGNIQIMLAAAIVIGFRFPAAWSFVLLTKVTPGIGLLWFAIQRRWRDLAIVFAVTGAIVAVTFVLHPDRWFDYITLLTGSPAPAVAPYYLPFWVRLGPALAFIVWGGVTGHRWPVVVGSTLALPVFYTISPSMLVGVLPFAREALGRQLDRRFPESVVAVTA